MNHQPFLTDLADVLEVNVDELTPDYVLESSDNWNSLALVSTIALIDEHYNVTVSGRSLRGPTTISGLLQAIETAKAS